MIQRLSAELVKYKKPLTAAIEGILADRYARIYDPVVDYGADPTNTHDSYAQIQACINDAIADRWAVLSIQGLFQISQPLLGMNCQGLTICANAYIYPTFDEADYVIGWCNGSNLRIYGRFEVSGQNKLKVKCGHKFWSDMNPNGFSFSYFYGLGASDILCGIQVGDERYPHAQVSELTFIGGYTAGTPCAIRGIGNQTYFNVTSFDAVSGGSGDLAPVTQYTYHLKGAQLKAIGGELQHNNNIQGAAVLVEPILDITDSDGNNYGNSYGNISSVYQNIESASQLCLIANLDSVPNPVSNRSAVSFVGSHGFHNQNNGGFINVHDQTAQDYAGTISYRDLSFYTTTTTRTQPSIVAGPNTIVDYDPRGFGKGFVKGLQSIQGGIVLFSRQPVLYVKNLNSQALPVGLTTLKYTEVQINDDLQRFTPNYSASTGRFTIPKGGLREVQVMANMRSTQDGTQLDVYLDGNLKTLKSPQGNTPDVNVMLGDLNEGQYIEVKCTMSTAGTANGGSLESMTIFASR